MPDRHRGLPGQTPSYSSAVCCHHPKNHEGGSVAPQGKGLPPLPAAAAAGGVPPPPPAAAGRSGGVVTTTRAVHHTPSTPAMAGALVTHPRPRWRAYPAHQCPVPHPPAPVCTTGLGWRHPRATPCTVYPYSTCGEEVPAPAAAGTSHFRCPPPRDAGCGRRPRGAPTMHTLNTSRIRGKTLEFLNFFVFFNFFKIPVGLVWPPKIIGNHKRNITPMSSGQQKTCKSLTGAEIRAYVDICTMSL